MSFLAASESSDEAEQMFAEELAEMGFVMNATRLWAYQPGVRNALFGLMGVVNYPERLSLRQRSILVAACTSTLGDSYCSLAWATNLAKASDAETAADVLSGRDERLSDSERALADWARKVARDPNGTSAADVQRLRDAGFTDPQIFSITVFVGLRIAFSTVNDALGSRPDAELRSRAPKPVLDAVTFGRPIEE